MSFLFPLYVLGALAIAAPILLHLRRRPPKERVEFSSLMFLEKSPERLTRRTRIERWLLLALRCLALVALALVFSRPFFPSFSLPQEGENITRALVLVDNSASMQREDLWDRALAEAASALETFAPADEVGLALFDEKLDLAVDFSEGKGLDAAARQSALEAFLSEREEKSPGLLPGWRRTDLGAVLAEAADRIGDESLASSAPSATPEEIGDPAAPPPPVAIGEREIVLISDFQEGASLEALNRSSWPEGLTVRCVPVLAEEEANLSLDLAAPPDAASTATEDEQRWRVRLSSSGPGTPERVALEWEGHPGTREETFLAPGGSRVLNSPPLPPGADSGVLLLSGDAHGFDNRAYVAAEQPRPLPVRYLSRSPERNRAGSPLFYLERALQETAAFLPRLQVVRIDAEGGEHPLPGPDSPESSRPTESTETESPDTPPPSTQPDPEVIVVQGDWPISTAEKLHAFAEKGGLVLATTSPDTTAEALRELVGESGWDLTEAEVQDYAMLASIDFDHPVFAPFARAGLRDFTKLRFWKHRHLAMKKKAATGDTPNPEDTGARSQSRPDTTVLARFDGGAPALVEKRVGDGRIVVFLSGWEPSESQLALSSKFIPILYSLLAHAGHRARSAPTAHVGDASFSGEGWIAVSPEKPGLYEVDRGDGKTVTRAVNLHPSEGRTAPLDPATAFADFGLPVTSPPTGESNAAAQDDTNTEETRQRFDAIEKEKRQKVWKWLVLLVLLFLFAETWVAGRRKTPSEANSNAEAAA